MEAKTHFNYSYLGNLELLNQYKIGFLCSRKVPAEIILQTYDWAIEQREKGICVISGFHSKIEKDVLHYLAKGKQPIIVVLARSLYKQLPNIFEKLLNENRLLIITPFAESVTRTNKQTAIKRNKLIIELANEIKTPFVSKNGLLAKLLVEKKIVFK